MTPEKYVEYFTTQQIRSTLVPFSLDSKFNVGLLNYFKEHEGELAQVGICVRGLGNPEQQGYPTELFQSTQGETLFLALLQEINPVGLEFSAGARERMPV